MMAMLISLRVSRLSIRDLVIAHLALMHLFGANAVPCFCTENRCTYGYCESPWCLVGIQHNGRVIRTCGNELSKQLQPCLQEIGDWQDVCACTTPYCNTFAFLRYEIKTQGITARPLYTTNPPAPKLLRPAAGHRQGPLVHFDRSTDEPANTRKSRKKGPHKDDPVVFDRNDEKEAGSLRYSYLIIVLVVVPLSIAGTAVVVIIIGYYCKMC